MLYLSTALYFEARPFITNYHLKKWNRFHKFQVFSGNHIILIITGTGAIASSVAISCVCSVFPPKEEDFFLSFGSAAALSENMLEGEVYLLHKITEMATDKTFYPDILFCHSFQEACGITGSRVLQKEDSVFNQYFQNRSKALCTYDMEAASSYMSASYFFGTHQMAFLRMISDYGISGAFEKGEYISGISDKITAYADKQRELLFSFAERLLNRKSEAVFSFDAKTLEFLTQTEKTLHLTVSMKKILEQHVKYYCLVHGNLAPVAEWSSTHIPSICKSKREGKLYFEELKRQLL